MKHNLYGTFVLLDVSLNTGKLDPLEKVLDVVGRLPAQLCVLLPLFHIPHNSQPANNIETLTILPLSASKSVSSSSKKSI